MLNFLIINLFLNGFVICCIFGIMFHKMGKLKKINKDLHSELSIRQDKLERDWKTNKKKHEKICEELGILVERKKIKNVSGKKNI